MIEIKICPDCPFKKYMIYLSSQSYTTTPNKKTALRTCQELRVIAKSFGEECKHFKGETLDNFPPFLGCSYATLKYNFLRNTSTLRKREMK